MSDSLDYAVVFEYTAAAGGYAGVRTWTAFKDKADFEQWLHKTDNKVLQNQKIVARGVSDDQAIRLVEETPIESYAAACVEESIRSGHVSKFLLEMHLSSTAMAIAHSGRDPLILVNEVEKLLIQKGVLVID
ncbi:MAG: hypothetical protein A2294_03040 [Candidatus Magasanikbacteria bacterium RIFOXYB2_FULL_38_10]|nr:MAG: hypothetical protein A2294_03040 [Candidatus Magasanikbacteria bacterium RIFOXYB2_FULL_38_10]